MAIARRMNGTVRSELMFWACFAVILALLSQALFPPQVMAASVGGQTRFILCTDAPGVAPAVDTASEKLFGSHKSTPYQGLKCANCVIASVTALAMPTAYAVPVRYAVEHVALRGESERSPIQPRAPPRPFSCGPPSEA